MKKYLIKVYNRIREWGWKYRKKTLHIIPETRYWKPHHLKFEEKSLEKDFGSDPIKLIEDIGKNVRAMPQIKIDDELVGGYNQLVEYFEKQGKVNFKGEIVSEW